MDWFTYSWIFIGGFIFITYLFQQFFTQRVSVSTTFIFIILGIIVSYIHPPVYNSFLMNHFEWIITLGLSILTFLVGSFVTPLSFKNFNIYNMFIGFVQYTITFMSITFGLIHFTSLPLYTVLILACLGSISSPVVLNLFVKENSHTNNTIDKRLTQIIMVDNALGILVFSSILLTIMALFFGPKIISIQQSYTQILLQLLLSILFGIITGFIFSLITQIIFHQEGLLLITLACIFILIGIAKAFNISYLLLILVFAISSKILSKPLQASPTYYHLNKLYGFIAPFLFLLIGTLFKTQYFILTLNIALIYLTLKCIGKYLGVYLGMNIKNADSDKILKYSGFNFISQAGLGFILILLLYTSFGQRQFGQNATEMLYVVANIMILTTVITEIVSTFITKNFLIKTDILKPNNKKNQFQPLDDRKITQ